MQIYNRNEKSVQLTNDRFNHEPAYEDSDKNSVSVLNPEQMGYGERFGALKLADHSGWFLFQSPFRENIPGPQLAGRLSPFAKDSTPSALSLTLVHFSLSTKLQKRLPAVSSVSSCL